ncbi:hypothetical protein A167_01291 [Alcanivorax sp. S71-1-4]|uniref:DUF1329 domain-containing protein n=1 Tax=Alcanivorax sp. S71-1-4 TaxID=1177159 RepID=UPI0013584AF7|nr:DUF1329 domain-containing protein [Alcanivorax sp. S71-1-4]KAF0809990.1 hypothetical protein A167_01291 [Alcanivorax sp. S71-1-4]
MKKIILAMLGLALSQGAQAAVSAEEAAKLGDTLTLFGAIQAGNEAGTIPPYTGGLTTAPADYTPGSGKYTNPFADEQPLYSVTAANMAEYDDVLTEGTKALLKKYSTYRIDVYPTHRTVAYPDSLLDGTRECATSARLTDELGGGFTGGFNCILFPMPQNGMEVMWNHKTRYIGERTQVRNFEVYNINTSGRAVLSSAGTQDFHYPFYDPDARKLFDSEQFFQMFRVAYQRPVRRTGEMLILKEPTNDLTHGRKAWSYLPGQRRVRMAPDISHDTPNPTSAGMTTYDDNSLGGLNRYDWKLVGKKEMLIPYNNYDAMFGASKEELLTVNHANPDLVRWELHRVWVVEATLKPGERHVYSKRRYYIDEDSWAVSAAESYDSRGELWRVPLLMITQSYDQQAPFSGWSSMYYDLNAGTWNMYFLLSDERSGVFYPDSFPAGHFVPEQMSGSGIR